MSKLQPLKVRLSRTQEKQTIEQYKGWFLITQKTILCMFLCCYKSSKMICKTSGNAPRALS